MTGGPLRSILAGGAVAAALWLGVPAAAQTYSDGYKFLQAVEKKEITEADKYLDRPGSTIINSRDISTGRTGLHIAVDRRDNTWLAYLIQRGANPNISDNKGVTPLMRASQLGFFEGIQTLISGGARIDEANSTGETPLILAVHRRDTEMMRALLKAGADPERTDNSGRSARDYAKVDGPASVTLAEIERSAKPASERRAAAEVYGPSF